MADEAPASAGASSVIIIDSVTLKFIATLTIAIVALAAGMCIDASIGRASYFGEAPFCVVTYGDEPHWDCEYHTGQDCVQALAGGIRGSCNVNPYYSGPSARATVLRQNK